jgi:hypothetical protein
VDSSAPDLAQASGGGDDLAVASDNDLAVASGRDMARSSAADLAVTAIPGPSTFHGINWADPTLYATQPLVPSGLSSTDSYQTVCMKTNVILSEFQAKLGVNALRIPITEPTVASPWWKAYEGVIDTATAKGMRVMIGYWPYHNGKPDSMAAFTSMWQTVVSDYESNNLVFFDIMNEPYGYQGTGWPDVAAQWLKDFPKVPRARVVVGGTGYDDDVTPVGADPRFDGCLLQLHIYSYWHSNWTTKQQWTDSMTMRVGKYTARTIVGEWGDFMNTGINYDDTSDGNNSRAYIAAVSEFMRTAKMGSTYWPGLRSGDGYALSTLNTSTNPWTLSVTNASGLDRVHWAWGL